MTDIYHDRIREPGTGTNGAITLLGPVAQYASFSRVGNGNTCRYTVVDADGLKWGTFGGVWSTGGSLSRVTTYESSNGVGVAVTFSAGTHDVFLTPDATQFPTAGGGSSPGGSDTQVQFNDSSAFGGDAGFTYNKTTNVLSLNGSANTLNLVGSATTAPVVLSATGSDTNIIFKVVPKGLGYLQIGPDTYGVSGWGGVWVGLECLINAVPGTLSQGGYFEINAAEMAATATTALSTNANTAGVSSGGNFNATYVRGQESVANSYLTVGHTLDEASGLRAQAFNVHGGTTTDAFGVDAKVTALAGAITNAYGGRFNVTDDGGTGTVGTAYGIRVLDVAVGTTKYSCYFGSGLYHFDALTASNWVLTDASKNLVSKTNTQATALLNAMVGDSGAGGTKGLVPAPATGDATKVLSGAGTWITNGAGSGASTALDNLAAVAINAALVLATSDAFALGSATKQWADLFLAEGGVINWDNGDVTITQTGDVLAVAGGDLRVATAGVGTNADSVPTLSSTSTLTNKTFVAPVLGAATATSINKVAMTGPASAATLTIADGKTLTVSNSITLSGTDGVAMNVSNNKLSTITFIIDGGGSAITTGVKGDLEIPFACTILGATLLLDQSGSIVVDIWKDTYANYPPTVADTITASAKPTVTTATKSQDNTLTGWTTSITAGDTLRFNVDSITTAQRATLSLKISKT